MNDIVDDSYQWSEPRDSKAPDLKPYADLEKALAEKDREITHLQDVYTKQRHKQEDAYRQLMEKAVQFARQLGVERVSGGLSYIEYPEKAQDFLASPEVQAWKEKP